MIRSKDKAQLSILLFVPVPPTPSLTKPPVPPLSIMPIYSSSASPDPGPASLTPPHRLPTQSRSFTHLRSISSFPEPQQHDYNTPIKLPPNYFMSARDPFPFFPPAGGPPPGRSLHPHHEHLARVWRQTRPFRSAFASGDGDTFDLPPAYSALDMARSSLRLRGVNGDE